MASLTFGSTRLALLLDADWDVDGMTVFHPARLEEWSAGFALLPGTTHVRVLVQALLISEGTQHTLVDTGFGDERPTSGPQSVLASLGELGVKPREISRVILTHAHDDHCLGSTLHRGDSWLPTYPAAEYVMQASEAAATREADEHTWQTCFQPLAERGQLRLIDGRVSLSKTLECWPTPGHTIGHQSVLIHAPGQEVLYLGDLAIFPRNLERLEWAHSWAWSVEADVRSRRIVNEWAIAESGVLIVGHEPEHPFLKMARDGERYRALPLAA